MKALRGDPMKPLENAGLKRGHGLLGDCHAQPLGPRQVLIVREESLHGLRVAPWQVRANIALRGLAEEDLESGKVLRFAGGPQVRITHECEVCQVLRQYVRREVFASLPGRRGSLGVILRGGPIALGDEAQITNTQYPYIPERIYERFAWVISHIPRGKVLTYETLIILVGTPRPYFRVLPTYLKRAESEGLPAHRVLDSDRFVIRHLPNQAKRLRRESVGIDRSGRLRDECALWDARLLYLSR